MTTWEAQDFLEECLDLVLLIFTPELVNKINHFDRHIILSLSRSANSASVIAEENRMNRKTVTVRLKKLAKFDVVTYTPSRNTRYALSDSFLKDMAKAAKILLQKKGIINAQNLPI